MLVGEVLDLVRELKKTSTTILMATHEMGFARSISDRVVFLKGGMVEEEGTPEKIFEDPEKESTKAFLKGFTA
jgi:polar amino acid transport system ATP-binding protein